MVEIVSESFCHEAGSSMFLRSARYSGSQTENSLAASSFSLMTPSESEARLSIFVSNLNEVTLNPKRTVIERNARIANYGKVMLKGISLSDAFKKIRVMNGCFPACSLFSFSSPPKRRSIIDMIPLRM